MRFIAVLICGCILSCGSQDVVAAENVKVDVSKVDAQAEVRFDTTEPGVVKVEWPAGEELRGTATIRLTDDGPLIKSLALQHGSSSSHEIAKELTPFFAITVAHAQPGYARRLDDFLRQSPHPALSAIRSGLAVAISTSRSPSRRGSLSLGKLTAGPFKR